MHLLERRLVLVFPASLPSRAFISNGKYGFQKLHDITNTVPYRIIDVLSPKPVSVKGLDLQIFKTTYHVALERSSDIAQRGSR